MQYRGCYCDSIHIYTLFVVYKTTIFVIGHMTVLSFISRVSVMLDYII